MESYKFHGMNIVFLGDFNTKIFQPAWFSREGLLNKQEADAANIHIVHQDITSFSLDWLNFEVTPMRLVMATAQEPYFEFIKDLAIGTFKLLRHTPIRAMGINKDVDFILESEAKWHAFGDLLTPKNLWQEIINKPGMSNISMEGIRTDGLKGYIQVRVGPSKKFKPGVYINVNDHFEIQNSNLMGCEEIIGILEKNWNNSVERSKQIISHLWRKSNDYTTST